MCSQQTLLFTVNLHLAILVTMAFAGSGARTITPIYFHLVILIAMAFAGFRTRAITLTYYILVLFHSNIDVYSFTRRLAAPSILRGGMVVWCEG